MKITAPAKIAILTLAVLFGLFLSSLEPVSADSLTDKEEKDDQESIVVGQVPPDFTATDLNGEEFALADLLGEKPIILDFWATWCGPCIASMPAVNEFTEKHGDEVEVVGITTWEPDTTDEEIQAFVDEKELIYRIIHNPEGEIATSYFVPAIPFMVVIGTDGTVVMTHLGSSDTLLEDLESALGL